MSQVKAAMAPGAEALNYMALAGYDTETSIAMLPNVLNLAAAGELEPAAASGKDLEPHESGILALLGIDASGAAADGADIGKSFFDGFMRGFDGKKVYGMTELCPST